MNRSRSMGRAEACIVRSAMIVIALRGDPGNHEGYPHWPVIQHNDFVNLANRMTV